MLRSHTRQEVLTYQSCSNGQDKLCFFRLAAIHFLHDILLVSYYEQGNDLSTCFFLSFCPFSMLLSIFFPIPNVYSQFVSDTLLFLCDKISNICSILFLSICSFGLAIPVYHLSRTGCFLTICSKTAILHLHCPIYNVIEALYNKKAYIFAIFSKSTKKSDILFCENKIKQYICKSNNKTRNIVII